MKVIVALFLLIVSFSALAAEQITGIYSSLYYNQEGGDLLGEELSIVRGAKGEYYGVLQCAQGEPDAPFIVHLKIKKGTIQFKVPEKNGTLKICPAGNFKGMMSGDQISGEFESSHYKVKLKKGQSYWQ